jgi:hypothetical protein
MQPGKLHPAAVVTPTELAVESVLRETLDEVRE